MTSLNLRVSSVLRPLKAAAASHPGAALHLFSGEWAGRRGLLRSVGVASCPPLPPSVLLVTLLRADGLAGSDARFSSSLVGAEPDRRDAAAAAVSTGVPEPERAGRSGRSGGRSGARPVRL